MLLGVIADDMTGATDVALMLNRAGMRTVQVIGVPPAGAALPEADGVSTVDLAAGPASRVAIPAGTGYLVQTVGAEAAAPAAGALFWVSDTGVRYGIEAAGNADELAKTVSALGLTEPATPIPWPVLSLFSPGPALSKDGALAVYQTPSQNPGNGEIR